ncbi:MAG: DNA polymerase III subunit alpha, partial [Silvanigrellaceae bacterium]|nr:DNA polymerase III subunit alpha [Silvanigrellaceae bacterium]
MQAEKHFTHLHLHTDFSLLDGAITIDKLIEYGKANKYKALAISDHGNVFGAVKFFEKCKKAKIKPIIGMEAYITQDVKIKNIKDRYYHLLLLVENEEGYRNLCKLIAASYVEGFYFKPRIDYNLLKKYHKGLIATSTCIGGHIPQLLLAGNVDKAKEMIFYMQDLFQDRYYLEVQPADLKDQATINESIFALEKELQIPVIATGDCHYLSIEDHFAHEVMLAIQTRTTMDDPNRMTFGDCRAYVRSVDEMISVFPGREDIVWRTGEVADRCNFEFTTGKLFFPDFDIPKEYTSQNDFFREECEKGLNALLFDERIKKEKISEYQERLKFEVDMIIEMGFVTYFLVVSDFIKWAKRQNIAVGPGRGSAAGSLASWCLEITDIDPLEYNLLFERFLNPERITMP